MACCILTAFIMQKIIRACEALDVEVIKVRYNNYGDNALYRRANLDTTNKQNLVVTKLFIEGMTCAACTSAIEAAVRNLPGVERLTASLPLSKATVVHDPSLTSAEDLVSSIERIGYGAKEGERTAQQNIEITQHTEEVQELKAAFSNAAMLASMIIVLDWLACVPFIAKYHDSLHAASAGLGIWVQLAEVWWIHHRAWSHGFRSPLTMNTLISLSLLGGLSLSVFNIMLYGIRASNQYFSSGSFLALIVIGGRYLDTLFRRQTSASLADLYRIQSETALVQLRQRIGTRDDITVKQSRVPAAVLQVKDEIIIDAGAMIPCDCYILEGSTVVDQSTMTGESVAATKSTGDFLMSGTRNLGSEIVAVVAREHADSSLEQLVSSISDATKSSKDQTSQSSDIVLSHFVRGVLMLALIGSCWTFSSAHDCSTSTSINLACERAMAVLVSACPCALGLATPSVVMTGVGAAWARGAILGGGHSTMLKLKDLTHIMMDKTGTLTMGQLGVSCIAGRLSVGHLILICAAERQDALTHPVAKAVFQWAIRKLLDDEKHLQNAAEIKELNAAPGMGVSCKARILPTHEWTTIHLGNLAFMDMHEILVNYDISLAKDASATKVHIAFNNHHVVSLSLHDTIRSEASSVIETLQHNFGLNLTMLTGDNEKEAQRVSKELGIPVLASRTLPDGKKALIKETQSQDAKNVVAMLGDGINDTPAMSAADVGIFLSPGLFSHSSSSSTALQRRIADIIITTPDLTVLPEIIVISQKTVRQAKLNTQWTILYNVVAVALATGIGERWGISVDAAMAGTMMAVSSCLVMLGCGLLRWGVAEHRLRTKRYEREEKMIMRVAQDADLSNSSSFLDS